MDNPLHWSNPSVEAALITGALLLCANIIVAIIGLRNGWFTRDGLVKVAEIQSKDKNRELDITDRDALNDDLQAAINTYKEMVMSMRSEMKARDDECAAERREMRDEIAQLHKDLSEVKALYNQEKAARLVAQEEMRLLRIGTERANEQSMETAIHVETIEANLKHIDEPHGPSVSPSRSPPAR